VYVTDRGIEELVERRGGEEVTVEWLADRLRDFVDLNWAPRKPPTSPLRWCAPDRRPAQADFEVAIDRLASWLARDDDPT
jgi:hypothetical protein